MRELPKGWESIRLKELVTSRKGKKPGVTKGGPTKGFVPYLDIESIEKGTDREYAEVASSRLATERDILIVWDGARSGWAGLGRNGAIGSTLMGLEPLVCDREYLYHFLQSQFDQVNTNTRGTGIPHVDPEIFWNIKVPLAPLNDQRRIVAKLEKLLGKVDACQQRLAKIPVILKRFRQSVLAAACSGRLTADWREENQTAESAYELATRIGHQRRQRYEELRRAGMRQHGVSLSGFDNFEPSLRTDLELPDIPTTWRWVNLRFLMSPEEPFCYGVVQPGEDDPNGPRLIRVGDLEGGRVLTSKLRGVPPMIHAQYKRSVLKGGEVLVSVVGTIGRPAIAPSTLAGANIARAVAKIPIREFEARFALLWFSTAKAEDWMISDAREVARKTLNLEQLRNLPVPLPPLAEQQEIIRRVEAFFVLADQIEARNAKAKGRVDQITKSLLAKAFCGELAPQNPNDEPASILLERIKTERTKREMEIKGHDVGKRKATKGRMNKRY